MTKHSRRPRLGAALPAVALVLAACSSGRTEVTLARPIAGIDAEIAGEIADLFNRESRVRIELTEHAYAGEDALRAIVDGEADVGLVSNAQPYREGIATIIPLFPTVLHIAYREGRDAGDVNSLLDGARVFAGAEGSASRIMFERYVERLGPQERRFRYVASADQDPDVIIVFAPIAPELLGLYEGIRLFSLGAPSSIGTGSAIDAATLLNPWLKPFVIPVDTYGDATPEPVLTVAVDKVLVARRDLDPGLVYQFISELLRLRPALSASRAAVFSELTGSFDPGESTFVLHAGAQAYIERDEPSIYERYSGIAEVAVTVLIALISAGFGGMRLYRMKRKNRIDKYYSDVIAIRRQAETGISETDRGKLVARTRELQDHAFQELVNERLAADESFRIFITLSNDVLRQLGATYADPGSSDS